MTGKPITYPLTVNIAYPEYSQISHPEYVVCATANALYIHGLDFEVMVERDEMIIVGYFVHGIDDWEHFTDEDIYNMSPGLYEFWIQHCFLILREAREYLNERLPT